MNKKIEIPLNNDYWSADIDRIVKVLADRGIECSRHDAEYLWSEFSESLAAGWMILPTSDDDVFASIAESVKRYAKDI
jgi:hypothetical protein